MIHLLDTGPLVSALAREEPRFGSWAKDLLRHLRRPLYTCEAVLTEAAHFLGNPDPVLAAVAAGLLVCPWEVVGLQGGDRGRHRLQSLSLTWASCHSAADAEGVMKGRTAALASRHRDNPFGDQNGISSSSNVRSR